LIKFIAELGGDVAYLVFNREYTHLYFRLDSVKLSIELYSLAVKYVWTDGILE